MGIIRESFVMFKNWAEAIEELPNEYQLETYKALVSYGIKGEIPDGISPIARAMLISFSVGMENNICRYRASVENGKKGGRPPKNKLTETQENLEKPNLTQENQTEPTQNLNVNVNDNVNDNVIKLVKQEKQLSNAFSSYINAGACERVEIKPEILRKHYVQQFQEYFDWCSAEKFRLAAYEIIDTMLEAQEQALTKEGLTFKQKKYTYKELADKFEKIDCDKFRSIITQIVFNEEIEHRPLYILGCVINAAETKDCATTQDQLDNFIKSIKN